MFDLKTGTIKRESRVSPEKVTAQEAMLCQVAFGKRDLRAIQQPMPCHSEAQRRISSSYDAMRFFATLRMTINIYIILN